MFQSVYYDPRNQTYNLVDTDFEALIEIDLDGTRIGGSSSIGMAIRIAAVYEKRYLNVAANLALYYAFLQRYWALGLNELIELNTRFWPQESRAFYDKYLADIKRYMLMI